MEQQNPWGLRRICSCAIADLFLFYSSGLAVCWALCHPQPQLVGIAPCWTPSLPSPHPRPLQGHPPAVHLQECECRLSKMVCDALQGDLGITCSALPFQITLVLAPKYSCLFLFSSTWAEPVYCEASKLFSVPPVWKSSCTSYLQMRAFHPSVLLPLPSGSLHRSFHALSEGCSAGHSYVPAGP